MKKVELSKVIITDKSEYAPFELIHWAGMGENYAYMVEEILESYPDYANYLTSEGENVAAIAVAFDNLEALKIIYELAPQSIGHVSKYGSILHVCLEKGAKKCWEFLIDKPGIDFNAITEKGLTLTHMACLVGAASQIEGLIERGTATFHTKDPFYERYPIYYLIDRYVAHQNNYLFEIVAEKYTPEQLAEKDVEGLDVWEFLILKQKGLPQFIAKLYGPLELTIGTMMGKFGN